MGKPQPYTRTEIRDKVLNHIAGICDYWRECKTASDRLEGLAFSILAMLDGSTTALPGFYVITAPHPDDKQFHLQHGERYFPEPPDGLDKFDIAFEPLHEHWHRIIEERAKAKAR